LLDLVGRRGVDAAALLCRGGGDLVEDLDQVGARAAAGVEHHDARVGQAVGDVRLLAQHGVDAGDHVLHDLGRRVPDPELLAQLGVERLEERLVEVLRRVALFGAAEQPRRDPRG
jgi:hypothetical protein